MAPARTVPILSRIARQVAAAGFLMTLACISPITASAQLDDLLRNFMRNAIPAVNPGFQGGSPTYRPAFPPYPNVSSPTKITELQRMLNDLGYDAGPADGALGPATVEALRSFQRDQGQPPDGQITAALANEVQNVWYDRERAASPKAAEENTIATGSSFNCARATSTAAREICANQRLAALDAQMASAYAAAKARLSPARQAKMTSAQAHWLAYRNSCNADDACLERAINQRTSELAALAGQNEASAKPLEQGADIEASSEPKSIPAESSALVLSSSSRRRRA